MRLWPLLSLVGGSKLSIDVFNKVAQVDPKFLSVAIDSHVVAEWIKGILTTQSFCKDLDERFHAEYNALITTKDEVSLTEIDSLVLNFLAPQKMILPPKFQYIMG